MANLFARIDGFLGRLAFRAVGCVTAFITLAALWAAFETVRQWQGGKSLAALVMLVAGAVVAGCLTRYCFSRERTLGDFIDWVDGDEADTVRSDEQPRRAPQGGSAEPN